MRDKSLSAKPSPSMNPGASQPPNLVQPSGEESEVEMLDVLFKKLLDNKKITKKQLLQKLINVGEKSNSVSESPSAAENILDGESDDDASH